MSETEGLQVYFAAGIRKTWLPWRYKVILLADDYVTGIEATVWLPKRARNARDYILENSVELLNAAGLAEPLMDFLKGARKAKALTQVKAGDRVRLAVDIGPYKAGRVCKVVNVGANGAGKYGISVQPVYVSGDSLSFGEDDSIALDEGEYGPLNEETA